ncbi:DUF4261 domain-containing protein [Pedobacter kyungheensis]|nr:DUF4261 domain-containing protein [Pedobacter kyungheensis]
MNLFNPFKKKNTTVEKIEPIAEDNQPQNLPEMLMTKLLFSGKPSLNADQILAELKKHIPNIDHSFAVSSLIFSFLDYPVQLANATIPAQLNILIPDRNEAGVGLPDTAFTQNWHWPEANEVAQNCQYEILITDLMSRSLPYKTRVNLFMDFLTAVIRVTQPDAVYTFHGDKLLNPVAITNLWETDKVQALYALCNVRLFNVSSDPQNRELLMDTIGMHALGLPDFQIRFAGLNENEMANLLWTYAYHVYEYGDIIEDGETIEGLIKGSKWKCVKQLSLVAPERMVINIIPR